MNIAILSPWAVERSSVGGTERYIIDLAEGLVSRGHHVTVHMLSGNNYDHRGVRYESLDIAGPGKVASEFDLQRLLGNFEDTSAYDKLAEFVEKRLSRSNPDIVHVNSLLFMKTWAKRRRIITIHTNPYEFELDWGKAAFVEMQKLLAIELAGDSTVATAPSQHYADYFSQITGQVVSSIPHAIDVKRIQTTVPRDKLCEKYGINSRKVTLLLPSRLEPKQKRPQIAYEALASLTREEAQSVQIISSGVDDQYAGFRGSLQAIAAVNGLECHFMRFDEMAEAYALAHIVGLPSCSESFGYAALESLSLGIPTILNDIPTYREIGDGNENAYFFHESSKSFLHIYRMITERGFEAKPTASDWEERYRMRQWIDRYEGLLQ